MDTLGPVAAELGEIYYCGVSLCCCQWFPVPSFVLTSVLTKLLSISELASAWESALIVTGRIVADSILKGGNCGIR